MAIAVFGSGKFPDGLFLATQQTRNYSMDAKVCGLWDSKRGKCLWLASGARWVNAWKAFEWLFQAPLKAQEMACQKGVVAPGATEPPPPFEGLFRGLPELPWVLDQAFQRLLIEAKVCGLLDSYGIASRESQGVPQTPRESLGRLGVPGIPREYPVFGQFLVCLGYRGLLREG